MKNLSTSLKVLTCAIFIMAFSSLASAATRTWVSGLGDDANPCSRTAPCKTFAGAISKTSAGGEINAIDPGGYGALTITKAVTVDGGGTMASTLAAGTNGFIINAGASDVVTLRNISINGATTGIIGIRILAAKSVTIENCVIFKFRSAVGTNPGRGISDERTAANSKLFVTNTTVNDNSSNAIVVTPTAGTSGVSAVLNNVRVSDNTLSGVFAGLGAKVSIRDSTITNNGNAGVQSADANTQVTIMDSVISHNAFGVFAGAGASSTLLSNVTITNNVTSGVSLSGGTVTSFSNNNVRNNGGGAGGNTAGTGVGQQ